MSKEFFKVARQEIQSELDSLTNIFFSCTDDVQFQEKSREIEKHIHNIKGLAPMMGQVEVGEIARISDIVLKHVITNGLLKGSQHIISEAVQGMNLIFKGDTKIDKDDFKNKVKDLFPQISGL